MSAISIWERSAQICFVVSVIVACDMVSFGVEFQRDSIGWHKEQCILKPLSTFRGNPWKRFGEKLE